MRKEFTVRQLPSFINGKFVETGNMFDVLYHGVLQRFNGDQFTGLAVGGTEHAGKAAATDPIRLQQESPTQRAGLIVRSRPTGRDPTKARAVPSGDNKWWSQAIAFD